MLVKDIMARDVVTVSPMSTIKEALTIMRDKQVKSLAVDKTHENDAYGIITYSSVLKAIVAEEAGEVIGFAIYYTSYSTWKGPCIYLEDLYVLPEKRNLHAGSKLFDAVVAIAKERKVARMDWQVLDWNQLAIDFYERKGATIDKDWYNGRMFFRENEGKLTQ